MFNPRNRLLIAMSLLTIALLLASSIFAAAFDATASVEPTAQYLIDTTGVVFTFTIENTGTSASIGAVEIERPSGLWKVIECPLAPTGWRSQDASTKCRYRSAETAADDLMPGQSSSAFQVRAIALGANENQTRNLEGHRQSFESVRQRKPAASLARHAGRPDRHAVLLGDPGCGRDGRACDAGQRRVPRRTRRPSPAAPTRSSSAAGTGPTLH